MYKVRKLKLDKAPQLDALSLASGKLYSNTITSFWRTVHKKNIWLKPSSMMRWQNSNLLHAHSADAVVQSFYDSLKSWRILHKLNINANPPQKLRVFFKIKWKKSAIKVRRGKLILSNGKGNLPLEINWQWDTPILVEIGWNRVGYELRATYNVSNLSLPINNKIAGVDLGEIHIATTYDGENCHIYNGRYLRSIRRYQNKRKKEISSHIDLMKINSRRYKRAKARKNKALIKLDNQINDILHKQTTKLVSTLYKSGVKTVVIGDVRDIRKNLNYGTKINQKMHQWLFGKTRKMISYKSEYLGMKIELQDESYTSQICPNCGVLNKPLGRNYKCGCGFSYHRDGIGAYNIRTKYLGELDTPHVVGVMVSPIGVRYAI